MYKLIFITFFTGIYIHCQAQTNVCFRVDMNRPIEIGLFETSSGDRVVLRGSFNNWQGDDYILNDVFMEMALSLIEEQKNND